MLADWLKKIKSCESELWIILTVMLSLALLFGLWHWRFNSPVSEPIKIENVPTSQEIGDSGPIKAPSSPAKSGNFVASKNGTKYYLPTCAGVKRIKEENKIWFKTVAEAEARGLTPAANCPGL